MKKFLNSIWFYILFTLCFYLPTVRSEWLNFYLLGVFLALVKQKDFLLSIKSKTITQLYRQNKNFFLFLLLFVLSFFIRIISIDDYTKISEFKFYFFLYPLLYLAAKTIAETSKTYKIFILFVLTETVVAIAEYLAGVNTFFTHYPLFRSFEPFTMFYETRVFGLSENSSVLALKTFFALLLLDYLNIPGKFWNVYVRAFLLIGLLITFGRAEILVYFFYSLYMLVVAIKKRNKIVLNYKVLYLIFIIIFSLNPKWTYTQFTRNAMRDKISGRIETNNSEDEKLLKELGVDKLYLSGRSEIWLAYTKYIMKYPLIGNRSKKLKIGKYHAHNSYLEIIASNGVLLAGLLLFILINNISYSNRVFIFSVLGVAMFKFAVLWSVSLFDALFFSILFFNKKNGYS